MTQATWRQWVKAGLGRVPYAAEAFQALAGDGKVPASGYSLDRLAERLSSWVAAAGAARAALPAIREMAVSTAGRSNNSRAASADPGQRDDRLGSRKRVVVFAYLQWWLEHAVALGLLLHARGHLVEFWYLPYRRWQVDSHRFDDRRQFAYLQSTLQPMASAIPVRALQGGGRIPAGLEQSIEQQSRLDVQYTLQREEIDWRAPEAVELLALRRRRNSQAAAAAYRWLSTSEPDSVIIPNGSILEFGALYRTSMQLGLTTVTYEFGEQRERMWLAQDDQVMRQPTDQLWSALGDRAPIQAEHDRVAELYQARVGGRSWDRFAREWQRADRQGAGAALTRLGLSPELPVVLLCTNVVGDSLALDRQLFTNGMSDWLAETVRFFAGRKDVQLVVRVHPGELLGAGHPSVDIVEQSLVQPVGRVAVVGPESELNTYDLIEAADLGLVYTSTVGLEMAMHGLPAIVSGATHYRGHGFTYDPTGVEQYFAQIDALLAQPRGTRLPQEQVELAWRYAYLFFFRYPFPYPWHLIDFWSDLESRPLEQVVAERSALYDRTLSAMVGEPIDWALPEAVRA